MPSVDAIVDRRNLFLFFFILRLFGGWSVLCSRVHSLGVAPRYESPRVYEIDEVPCTDPLPLYAEFFSSHAIGRSSWLYGGVVYSDEFCIWLFDDLCRTMVRSIVCILP